MIITDYQRWLNSHGQDIAVDGDFGQVSAAAMQMVFSNPFAPAVTDDQMRQLAEFAGVDYNQLVAVANVESSGGGFDSKGRPKILYERHKFSACTHHLYDTTSYSNPVAGGYNENSWEKLSRAIATGEIDCAFQSCSWGKFQIMGFWYPDMMITSALDMGFSQVLSEYHHYRVFIGYIKLAGLLEELRLVSTNPDDCRPFAKGYNGSNYEAGGYHEKIAQQMVWLEAQ
jgi:hypothetical protein